MNEIIIMTFGYLYGLPEEANTVLDMRGLPNPYWVEELRDKTGLDREVRDYVFSTPEAERYFETCLSLLRQRIAFFEAYDSPLKQPLVIAVGCSGGRHRSVSMAVRLAEALEGEGIPIRVLHRDLDKVLEHSAGAVVFTRGAGELRFLTIRSPSGLHELPELRMRPGEREQDAALRAVFQATGLQVRPIHGFRAVDVHPVGTDGKTFEQIVYCLAACEDLPDVQEEAGRCGARWMRFDEAIPILELESVCRVLTQAHAFLTS